MTFFCWPHEVLWCISTVILSGDTQKCCSLNQLSFLTVSTYSWIESWTENIRYLDTGLVIESVNIWCLWLQVMHSGWSRTPEFVVLENCPHLQCFCWFWSWCIHWKAKSVNFSIKMQTLQCKAIIIIVFTQPEDKISLNSNNKDGNYIRRVLILWSSLI